MEIYIILLVLLSIYLINYLYKAREKREYIYLIKSIESRLQGQYETELINEFSLLHNPYFKKANIKEAFNEISKKFLDQLNEDMLHEERTTFKNLRKVINSNSFKSIDTFINNNIEKIAVEVVLTYSHSYNRRLFEIGLGAEYIYRKLLSNEGLDNNSREVEKLRFLMDERIKDPSQPLKEFMMFNS